MVQLSVWAQDLIDHVTRHMDSERDALTAYRELADAARDQRIRYLALQVLADEIRHHTQFAELRDFLRAEVEQRPRRALHEVTGNGAQTEAGWDDQTLRDRTEELLELERDDIRELKRLARQMRQVADTRWCSTLIDVMELDTRKHIKILEQIRELLSDPTS